MSTPVYKGPVEVDGRSYIANDKADSGDTTVLSVAPGYRVKLYGASITPAATLTGNVLFKIGSNQVTPKTRNAIVGGNHWLIPLSDNYILGEDGEDVVINNSEAEDLSYAIYYDVIPV